MEITDLKVKNKNSIVVKDSLKAPLLRLSVSLDNSTTIPTSNDLIVYLGKNETSEKREYNYTLSKSLKYLDNVSDEFILSPKLNGERIDLKAYVIRRVGDSSILDKEVIEEFFYEPIILDEGENYITTNYSNAILEIVYPKDTDIVNYFLSNSMYKESDNSLTLDDIYFKDAFTEADEGINANFNRVNLNCFKLKDSPFGLDALGNLTVNSLITVDNPTSGSDINFDMIYPVGSVYVSNINSNPKNLFGGTWQLIDKEFKETYGNYTTADAVTNSGIITSSPGVIVTQCAFERSGHTITTRVVMKTTVALQDANVTLFALNMEKLGITSFGYALRRPLLADGGNGLIIASINGDGNVISTDVIMKDGSNTLPVGAEPNFSYVKNIRKSYMLDSACDKFYWKRIA